jgi:hypothetical protein
MVQVVWEDNWGVGLTFPIGPRVGWSGAVGGIYVHRTDDDVGTNLNFLFRVSYCGERLCASFAHVSRGNALGVETGKANSGLNFLYLEYRTDERTHDLPQEDCSGRSVGTDACPLGAVTRLDAAGAGHLAAVTRGSRS